MKSSALNVDDYVAQVDDRWRPTSERLRASCLETLSNYREAIAYGIPTYEVGGLIAVGFAKQVQYFSFYIAKKGVLDAHRDQFVGLSVGKGCIRFKRPEQVDWSLIDILLRETAASAERPC